MSQGGLVESQRPVGNHLFQEKPPAKTKLKKLTKVGLAIGGTILAAYGGKKVYGALKRNHLKRSIDNHGFSRLRNRNVYESGLSFRPDILMEDV